MKHKLFYKLTAFAIAAAISVSTVYAETTTTPESTTVKTEEETTLSPPTLKSEDAIVMDADSGKILFSQNSDTKHYPASCTKILTAILGIENGNLADTVTMSHDAIFGIDRNSSHIALDVDEQLTLEQLLYGMLVASANDCAMGVAEYIGGTFDNFYQMMNDKAKELGATSSHFSNPHGLFDEEHYTTAHDLAVIMSYCIKNETFKKIIGTKQYSIPPTNKQTETRIFNTTNLMLSGNEFAYSGMVGGKTGWIDESKNNLVTYTTRNNMNIVVVVMGSDTKAIACEDTTALLDYTFGTFKEYTFSSDDYSVNTLEVDNLGKLIVYTASEFSTVVDKQYAAKDVTYKTEAFTDLSLPLSKDTQVGKLIVYGGNEEIGSLPIYTKYDISVPETQESPKTSSASSFFKNVLNVLKVIFIIAVIVIGLFLILVIFLVMRKKIYRIKKHRKHRKRK